MIYSKNIKKNLKNKTLIVLGPPRSGTSMLAGVLKILGVYMGESNRPNHEDHRFNHKVSTVEEIREIVADYNSKYSVWGWKEPSTHNYLSEISDVLRNPVYIVSCRNPFDAALSKIKRTNEGDFEKLLTGVSNQYIKNIHALKDTGSEIHYVNHEMALAEPKVLAEHLAKVLGIELSQEKAVEIEAFCAPGSYKKIAEVKV